MEMSSRFEKLNREIKAKDINVGVICILILFESIVLLDAVNSSRRGERERKT